jgi:hypothetical protein
MKPTVPDHAALLVIDVQVGLFCAEPPPFEAQAIVVVADAHTTADNPVLKADLVRQHHNWAWANCLSSKGVTVLKAGHVRFAASAAA